MIKLNKDFYLSNFIWIKRGQEVDGTCYIVWKEPTGEVNHLCYDSIEVRDAIWDREIAQEDW